MTLARKAWEALVGFLILAFEPECLSLEGHVFSFSIKKCIHCGKQRELY